MVSNSYYSYPLSDGSMVWWIIYCQIVSTVDSWKRIDKTNHFPLDLSEERYFLPIFGRINASILANSKWPKKYLGWIYHDFSKNRVISHFHDWRNKGVGFNETFVHLHITHCFTASTVDR